MSKTILTVDDSKTMRDMLRLALADAGHAVIQADDGLQGVEVLVGAHEGFLRDILGLDLAAQQAGGGGEDHVLIGAHERGEFRAGFRGGRLHWRL